MAKYILIDRVEQPSKLNGGYFWRLKFYCLDDKTYCEMTVDPSYRNFDRWRAVVQDESPWGVYDQIRRVNRKTKENLQVVTADNPARLIYRATDQEQALQLVELDLQDEPPTTFGTLFQ